MYCVILHKGNKKMKLNTKRVRAEDFDASSSSSEGSVKKTNDLPCIKKDGDFKDLVTQSTIFADKSLFIKDVLEDSVTGLLIAMPRRWGKSVNLNMLKRFLEKPLDDNGIIIQNKKIENYTLFAGGVMKTELRGEITLPHLKIADQKIFDSKDALDVQGTYPVIYIDFKNCKADDFASVQKCVKITLSHCFRDHTYLEKSVSLRETDRQKITEYIDNKVSNDEIKNSLKFLSEMLYKHHEKKVWILIDEYDAAINKAYREFEDKAGRTDSRDVGSLFSGIYESALKGNEYLEKSVITGIQFLAKAEADSGLNNLEKIDITNAKYSPHYALTQEECKAFFDAFHINDKIITDHAKLWYNGYKVKYYDQRKHAVTSDIVDKYNIWSIISYLKDGDYGNYKSYWEESGNINFVKKLFKANNVKDKIEQLISGEAIEFTRKSSFDQDDYTTLKELLNAGAHTRVTSDGLNILLSYLFIVGYLTIDGKTDNHYQIPNMEIKYEMRQKLLEYYETIYPIDNKKLHSLTGILQNVFNTESLNYNVQTLFTNFYHQFKELINDIKLVNNQDTDGIFTNEDAIHSILNYIALQTTHTKFGTELYTTLSIAGKGRADIKISNDSVGMIIEVKCMASNRQYMQAAIKQAIGYKNLIEQQRSKIFVAINVEKQEGEAAEMRALELLCVSNMDDRRPEVFGLNLAGESDTFDFTFTNSDTRTPL